MESLVVWLPPPPVVVVLPAAPFEPCEAFPPLQVLKTHTGAFPSTGAFADALGLTAALPT